MTAGKGKKIMVFSWVAGLMISLSAGEAAGAAILFQNDTFDEVLSDSVVINSDDESTGSFGITFGTTLGESLLWNATLLRFELSDDLVVSGTLEVGGNIDVNLNQLVEARAENLASAPTCNAGSAGRIWQNTTDAFTYVCDGANIRSFNNIHYQNGTLTAGVKTATITGVDTTGTTTTLYVTNDGTSGGTKLFTTVYHVSAEAAEIQSDEDAPSMSGYAYNSSTGALQIKFLESAGILLGGQGLEGEESGTPFTVFVTGI